MSGESKTDLQPLLDLVARLRGPQGCPWDRAQGLPDLRAYLLEEAHEVVAKIDERDWAALGDELGDLVFQVAFIARLAEESGEFTLAEVLERVHRKMVERHPHVFGSERLADAEAVNRAWERRKAARETRRGSLLDGVAVTLPALVAAYRLTQKAAGVGFDWSGPEEVWGKVDEELAELRTALADDEDRRARVGEEVGDALFALANLARHLDVDPEGALAAANLKFRRRFERIERALAAEGRGLEQASLEEMEALWQTTKE